MAASRRDFIKKSAVLTALSAGAIRGRANAAPSYIKDANIQLCLAYFYGLQERKMELSRQMGVTGVVSPSSPWMLDMHDTKPLRSRHPSYAEASAFTKVSADTSAGGPEGDIGFLPIPIGK